MSLKRNICTKVISGGVVAMQILTSTIPAFGYDSLRQPDDFFNRFGSQKRDIIAYVNRVINTTPDVYVLNLETDKGVNELVVAQLDDITVEKHYLTQEEFHNRVEEMGIKRTKDAGEYTEEEIDNIVPLLSERFKDIRGDEWYIRDLAVMVSKGIINGVGDGSTFQGDRIVTRAEYWAMNGRLLLMGDYKDCYEEYGMYCTPNTLRNIKDMVTYLDGYIDMHKLWWFPYYYRQSSTIPFGVYNIEQMGQPIYRGEAALLTGFPISKREGVTFEKMGTFAKTRYFSDVPTKFLSTAECHSDTERCDALVNELGVSLPFYHPPFERVVKGEAPMTESSVRFINYTNYAGIMCGLPDGSSGWNKELTRGEAIAVLARAFRPQQRLPYDKRKKDMSSLGYNAGDTELSDDLVEEIEDIAKDTMDNEDSGVTSGTSQLDTSKTPFDPSDKYWWFERRLGFHREMDDIYTELMTEHFDILGIKEGTFKERHDSWYYFIRTVLKIEIDEDGLAQYLSYLDSNGFMLPR